MITPRYLRSLFFAALFSIISIQAMTPEEWQAYKQSDAYKQERARIEARKMRSKAFLDTKTSQAIHAPGLSNNAINYASMVKHLPISAIKNLGNPYKNHYKNAEHIFSRNIWDMHTYKGKIFFGAGNSANKGPSPNSGPVHVISYDPKEALFSDEGIVAEEQIDSYRTINGELFIPGHDATQNWSFGNLYKRLHEGTWKKYRTVPNALHLFDLAYFDKRLFTGLGLNNISGVAISLDMGKTWKVNTLGNSYSRVYSFIEVDNTLYAMKSFTPLSIRKTWEVSKSKDYFSVGQYHGNNQFIERYDLTSEVMFPDTSLNSEKSKKIIRTNKIGTSAIYIGAYIFNDHHALPFGAYVASSLKADKPNIQKVPMPKHYVPWDTLVKGEHVYLLCYDGENVIVLHALASDLSHWNALFQFSSVTFARSFEMLNDDFYFGLGSDVKSIEKWHQSELYPQTGDILKVSSKDIKSLK